MAQQQLRAGSVTRDVTPQRTTYLRTLRTVFASTTVLRFWGNLQRSLPSDLLIDGGGLASGTQLKEDEGFEGAGCGYTSALIIYFQALASLAVYMHMDLPCPFILP